MVFSSSFRRGGITLGLGLVLLVGCGSPINLAGGSSPSTPPTARSTLQTLPDLKVTLPGSLSKSGTSTVSKSLARTAGATTELVSVPALKSQAWFDLQSNNGFQGFINKALKFLRDYANTHDVQLDQPFALALSDDDLATLFGMPDSARGSLTTNVQLRVIGNPETKITIYALVSATSTARSGGSTAVTVKARMDVAPFSGGKTIDFFMKAEQTTGGDSFSLPVYAHFNTATGACDIVQDVTTVFNGTTYSSEFIQKSIIGSGGEVTTINLGRQNGAVGSVQVAYGDNVSGGIASLFQYTETSQSQNQTHSSLWGEYYDGNGNLIKRVNGDDHVWVPVWSQNTPVLNLRTLGFTAAPTEALQQWDNLGDSYSTLQIKKADGSWMSFYRQRWDGLQWTSGYSDDGSTWIDSNDASWGRPVTWRASDADEWKGGDAVYYWKSSDSGVTTLYQGYVVPAPVTRFGKVFFPSNEYPLDTLLPLQEPYATTFKLIQKEGGTYEWTWTDSDGKPRNDSWTSYSFFLNKTQADEDPISLNTVDGDIDLYDKLSVYDMYYYQSGVQTKTKGYFLRTTGSVPAYFKQPDLSLVNRVDSKLDAALQTAYQLDVSAYSDQLSTTKGDLTAGIFPN